MKNKGILISLAAILVIGILITKSTHHFIENNTVETTVTFQAAAKSGGAAVEEGALSGNGQEAEAGLGISADTKEPQEALPQMAAAGPDTGIAPQSMFGTDMEEAGGLKKEITGRMAGVPEAYSAEGGDTEPALVSVSPLDTAAPEEAEPEADQSISEEKSADTEDSMSYYRKRLQDLDHQILKSRDSLNSSNLNNSAKSAASNELKLWDGELVAIYNEILDRLDQEETEKLVEAQRAWMKERDSLAMEAVKNSAGGSSESVEYTISLTQSTRQRAYELVELYEAKLAD